MSSPLLERLSAERRQRFVGRRLELELFQSALAQLAGDAATELPFHLLYIFGPGGVGKSSLLWQFIQLCEHNHRQYIYIDGRNLEPAVESFLSTIRAITGSGESGSDSQAIAAQLSRTVVLLDTYETLVPLDAWLREEFLPQLPDNTLIAIASRYPPAAAWRTDPGWQAIIHLLPLRNLSPMESQAYLTKRAVPVKQHQAVLNFTHGYPLALSLVADVFAQGQNFHFKPEAFPDVIKTLLEKFVQDIPSPTYRMALEACALARITTEALLSQMLAIAEVHDLFEWLRQLSFIESGQLGIFPHDLAREVLIADLRWRNPDWYAELHQRARNYYSKCLSQTFAQEQHRVLFDYIFLHRDCPDIRPRFSWQEQSSLLTDTVRETDRQTIWETVAAHEGEESAELAAHWLARQPQGVLVFRNPQQQLVGFVLMVALHQASSADLRADPAAIASWQYLQTHAPLRQHEGATLFRFWMAKDTYQAVSPTQSLIFINFVQHHQHTTGPAFTFYVCAEPDFWAAMFAYADLARLPEADFVVGGKRYGVYGHDWRVVTPAAWQALLARREIAAATEAISPEQHSEPLLVLSQIEFTQAVQAALRNFRQTEALRHNPLLRSRLVLERVSTRGVAEQVAALQAAVQAAAASLKSSPREEKLYRALDRTYLHPASTQEQAAELLDLPFSTFRRHLKVGVKRVVDILWQQEIN